jgi:hypothetical protein
MTAEELKLVREQSKAEAQQTWRQQQGTDGTYLEDSYSNGFFAPNDDAMLFARAFGLPPRPSGYLDTLCEQATVRMDQLLRQGTIRKVYSVGSCTLQGTRALVSDFEAPNGVRNISYSFYSPDHPRQQALVMIACMPGKYPALQNAIGHVIGSLSVSFGP